MKKKVTRLFSVLLAAVLVFGTLPVSALGTDVTDPPASTVDESAVDKSVVDGSSAESEDESAVDDAAQLEEQSAEVEAAAVQSAAAVDGYDMNIFFLDCGRKYYSVSSIEQFIDNASKAGFNYIQLAVGNDGLRFLLDNMELTVNGKTYGSDDVKAAIQTGNRNYYNFTTNELTQSEMDTIIGYAHNKGMGVIPCVNSPGHMDAILDAAEELTGKTCSYNRSARTIDVTNTTAVAFTQALLQKYIDYFAGKGCRYFNMGADEYANDMFTSGAMGFGNLQSTGKYGSYVTYVNQVAALIKGAGMKPMAFNDGIYFNNNTSYGAFDTDIVICYWSNGWTSYTPMPAADLAAKGFQLVNTHGDYYWVLGKSDWQCSASKASGFKYKTFQGGTIDNPVGSMFCVWADYPNAESETSVISKTAATIAAFGKACPPVDPVTETPTTPSEPDTGKPSITAPEGANALKVNGTTTLEASETVTWKAEPEGVVDLTSADDIVAASSQVSAKKVAVKALKAGAATITATNDAGSSAEFALEVTAAEDTGDKTDNVTVAVNATKAAKVAVTGDYTTVDYSNEYVTVTTSKETTDGSPYYESASLATGTFYVAAEANATNPSVELTVENVNGAYYIKNSDGNYIFPDATYTTVLWWGSWGDPSIKTSSSADSASVNITTNSDGSIVISKNVTSNGQTKTFYVTLSNNTFDADTSSQSLYLYTQKTTPGTTTTKVSFTGKKVTEENKPTTITIGDVTYNVTVTAADLPKVDPLKIEYWITNTAVTADGATSKELAATEAYGENGKKLSELVPESGTTTQNHEARLWKGTRHLSGNEQTTAKGDDKTGAGNDYSYIRYWNDAWEFSADGTTWNAFNSDDQVVAYYMQRTTVTDEITTDVVDWGENVNSIKYTHYVELDFAIQYPNGDRTPTSFPVSYTDEDGKTQWKTMEFHCNNNTDLNNTVFQDGSYYYRRIGRVNAVETSEYEVYMITLKPTSDSKSEYLSSYAANRPSTYTYDGTEKVVWVDDEANLGNFKDESLHAAQYHCGGEATVPYIDIYQEHGMLVTYYVRAKATNDSLAVYYVEKNTGDEIYHYNIAVKSPETFKTNIALDRTSEDSWKGPLVNGTVTNSNNKEQTVSADLSTMPEIEAGYRYADYTCDEISLSSDHKVLTLYYTFNKTAAFTVDFGVPLNISLADINQMLDDNAAKITKIDVSGETHGKATINSDKSITYTPDTRFVGSENGEQLSITYAGTNVNGNENGITYRVYIYPASNVLYEESFLSKPDGDNTWSRNDAAAATQETQKVGDTTKTYNVFGYDDSYSSSTNENGVWSITGLEKNKYSAPLTTEFYGNTFDLIGDCGPTTGGVLLTVIKDGKDGKHATIANIDTRYDDGTNTTIHQVPLAHIVMANEKYGYDDALCTVKVYATGLEQIEGSTAAAVQAAAEMDADAEYDALLAQILEENDLTMDEVDFVTISAADNLDVAATPDAVDFYSAAYASDGTGTSGYQAGNHVEIDGFRVYRSAVKTDAVAVNYPANEQDVSYVNIWDAAKNSFVGFTDKKGEVTGTVQDYIANGGPQNEIYLKKGNDQNHAVVFQIGNTQSTIQVSLRAVKDNDPVKVNLGNEEKTITSVTEMYYEITSDESGVFTIANTGNGILAIGNVKLPSGNQIISAQELGDEVVSKALTAALYGNAEPDPEPDPATFAPETFETKVSSSTVIRNKVVTLKVTVSSDVAYITVNGKKYARTGLKGFGGKNRTIRVVSVMPKDETPNFEIVAYNANGEKSETKTVSE